MYLFRSSWVDSGKLLLTNSNINMMITASWHSAAPKLPKSTTAFYMGEVIFIVSGGRLEID